MYKSARIALSNQYEIDPSDFKSLTNGHTNEI